MKSVAAALALSLAVLLCLTGCYRGDTSSAAAAPSVSAALTEETLLRETEKYAVYYIEDGEGTVVIDKSKNRRFEKFLKPYCLKKLQPLLWEGLSEALNEDDQDILREYTHTENGRIQLPLRTLRPVEGGLVFEYQEGELVSCTDGEIEFTILQEDLYPFLTRRAKKLLGVTDEEYIESIKYVQNLIK